VHAYFACVGLLEDEFHHELGQTKDARECVRVFKEIKEFKEDANLCVRKRFRQVAEFGRPKSAALSRSVVGYRSRNVDACLKKSKKSKNVAECCQTDGL